MGSDITISFNESVAFDYAALVANPSEKTYMVKELPLIDAYHSTTGKITYSLEKNDGMTEELYPGESIKLNFGVPLQEANKRRSFIIVTTGRYERIEESGSFDRIPKEFSLKPNYPNPFNPLTTVSYQIAKASNVSLSIYNQLGQQVASLTNEHQEAGYYEGIWNATNVPSGIYYLRLLVTDDGGRQLYLNSEKIVLMK
ncbi:MAG: T9SS type A sorting domain-containing protein [Ignavibacteriales bacterium]|nr:T9SS type A sorting domain-containing protein [Ignavibacteriales bacterium]